MIVIHIILLNLFLVLTEQSSYDIFQMGCKCTKEKDGTKEAKTGDPGKASQETAELLKTSTTDNLPNGDTTANDDPNIPNNNEQEKEKNTTTPQETTKLLKIPSTDSHHGDVTNATNDEDHNIPDFPNNEQVLLSTGMSSLGKSMSAIDASVEYLRDCDDYTTDDAWHTINRLAVSSCIVSSVDPEQRVQLAGHLVKVEFAPLFVKIVTSLQDDVSNHGIHKEESLRIIKGTCTNFCNSDECQSLVLDLIRHGAITMLLKEVQELDVSNQDENTEKQLRRVVQSLDILSNCVRCPDVRASYRSANAVPILFRCLKSKEIKLKMEALSILAYIISDEEGDMLANTEGCINLLVQMLNKAATAKQYYVHYTFAGAPCGSGVYALIDTVNRLVLNDCNKREVVSRGGIPTLLHILQIQNDTAVDSQLAAIETLWQLAFIESHRQAILQHIQDAQVITGKRVATTSIYNCKIVE